MGGMFRNCNRHNSEESIKKPVGERPLGDKHSVKLFLDSRRSMVHP